MPSYDRLNSDPTLASTQRATRRAPRDNPYLDDATRVEASSLDATLETAADETLDKTVVRPYPQQEVIDVPTYDPSRQADVASSPYDIYDQDVAYEDPGQRVHGSSVLGVIVGALALAACLALGYCALTGRIALPGFSSGNKPTQQEQQAKPSEDTDQQDQSYVESYDEPEVVPDDTDIPEYDESGNEVPDAGQGQEEVPSYDEPVDDGTGYDQGDPVDEGGQDTADYGDDAASDQIVDYGDETMTEESGEQDLA